MSISVYIIYVQVSEGTEGGEKRGGGRCITAVEEEEPVGERKRRRENTTTAMEESVEEEEGRRDKRERMQYNIYTLTITMGNMYIYKTKLYACCK